jgi:protein involved in polysaccharide export with SLBB domain
VSVTPTTPSEFPYIEKSQSVSGDDLTTDAQAYVDKYSLSQAEIEAELDQVLIDFYDLNVGDKIHIRIDQDNTFLDFEDDLEVIYKKSRVINGDLLFEAKVSTSTKQVVSGQAKLAGLETRIKTLELR